MGRTKVPALEHVERWTYSGTGYLRWNGLNDDAQTSQYL